MGKIKKESAQNLNVVAKQSIHEIISGSVQKNKIPKFKGTSRGKAASMNDSKMQNKNKLPQKNLQKTTDTKNNQNLLQNNKQELKEQYSLKRKKNTSNKPQNKLANKMKKKELEVDDSESLDYKECKVTVKLEKILSKKDNEDSEEDKDNESWRDEKDVEGENSKNKNNDNGDDDDDNESEDEDHNESEDEDEDHNENEDDHDTWECDSMAEDFILDEDHEVNDNINDMDTLVVIGRGLMKMLEGKKYVPLPDEVVNRTTIEIGHLPKTITEEEIKTKFEEFGSIENIHLRNMVQKDKNKLNVKCPLKVSALIEYNCPLSARRAFSMHRKLFGGNIINVQYMDRPIFPPIFDSSKCVCLNNLVYGIDKNSVWKLFSKCGEIEYVNVCRNQTTGFTLGFGYVVFMTEDAVNKALKLNGTMLLNYPVEVEACYPKKVKDRKDNLKKVKK